MSETLSETEWRAGNEGVRVNEKRNLNDIIKDELIVAGYHSWKG